MKSLVPVAANVALDTTIDELEPLLRVGRDREAVDSARIIAREIIVRRLDPFVGPNWQVPEQAKQVLDTIIRVLNEATKADPAAMHALLANRVPCNRALRDHATVQVHEAPVRSLEEKSYSIGMLGIVSGIAEAVTGGRVAAMWSDEEGQPLVFLGFCRYGDDRMVKLTAG